MLNAFPCEQLPERTNDDTKINDLSLSDLAVCNHCLEQYLNKTTPMN